MTSITVQRTGFGIVVAESDDAEATALLDGLPPLRAARYLTATPALRDALRSADAEVVDAVLPHLDGEVVVPEAGLARPGDDGEAESTRLAQALGVSVVAPEGRIVRCEGTLFSVGGGDGWIAQSPLGARVRAGRRYPAPAWQAQLPESLLGAAHIPAGLWITAGTEPRHAVRLAGIAVRERQLLVVAGSPSEPAPSEERLLAMLRALPVETRSAVVLAGFGAASLPLATVRSLAAALDQPLRVAHGVEIDGDPVRIDGAEDALPTTLALESVCAPDGSVTLERWAPPPGLVAANAVEYRLGETARTRRAEGDRWLVHVVAAGLVVRPAGQPLVDQAALEAPAASLGIFVQCDGAHQPAALPALLAPLRARLEQRGAVTIHPVDGAARRVVRDAYPGTWAPTESLAITADGRIVAAAADASGDTIVDGALVDAVAVAAVEHDASAMGAEVEEGAAGDVERLEVSPAAAGATAEPAALPASDEPAPVEQEAAPAVAAEPASAGRRGRRARRPRIAELAAALRPQPTASREQASASSTVDAVIGADGAAAPEESVGAASRRARDAHVTYVPTVDPAAAAWYAAAVRRPVPAEVDDEPAPTGGTPSAPTPTAIRAPAPTASPDPVPAPSGSTSAPTPTPATTPATTPSTTAPSAATASPTPAPPGPTSTSSASRPTARPASTPEPSATPTPEPASAPAPAPAPEPVVPTGAQRRAAAPRDVEGSGAAAAAADAPAAAARPAANDALARALQGSAATRLLGAGTRSAAAAPRDADAQQAEGIADRAAAAPAPAAPADQVPAAAEPEQQATSADAEPVGTTEPPAPRPAAPAIDVPLDARSTADQRHRVRTALGSRYDVASRTVSQLLAQQPGMRVASDRSAMLTGLSLVRVFATEPRADYDLDFHTCLAEGLAMLPTARSVVVRGIPAALDAAPGSLLRLRTPLVAAAIDGPATGPSEALIWTTSGRRLDRVLHGTPGAADVVLPAGVRLRVLGTAEGPSSRLLLAEDGADAEQALARLQAAADSRGEVGEHADDRWLGDLPLAA